MKTKPYGYNLGSLQRKIIKHIAEIGPQTINEANSAIEGHYHSTHIAFSALKVRLLIEEVAEKKAYRGREFKKFWLTNQGILAALINKVDFSKIKKNIKEFYGERFAEFMDFEPMDKLVEFHGFGRISGKNRTIMLLPTQEEKNLPMPWIKIFFPKNAPGDPFTGQRDRLYVDMNAHIFYPGKT